MKPYAEIKQNRSYLFTVNNDPADQTFLDIFFTVVGMYEPPTPKSHHYSCKYTPFQCHLFLTLCECLLHYLRQSCFGKSVNKLLKTHKVKYLEFSKNSYRHLACR